AAQEAPHFLIAGAPLDLGHRVGSRRPPELDPPGKRLATVVVGRPAGDHSIQIALEVQFLGWRCGRSPELGQGLLQDLFGDSWILGEHQAELERRARQQPNVRFEPRTVSGGQRVLLVHLFYERTRLDVYTRSLIFSGVTGRHPDDYEQRPRAASRGRTRWPYRGKRAAPLANAALMNARRLAACSGGVHRGRHLVEAQLQQLQTRVVVLPEVVLQR